MRFRTFAIMAFLGAAIWCTVLTIFGVLLSRDMAIMVQHGAVQESASYRHAVGNLTLGTVALVAFVALLYALFLKHDKAIEARHKPMVHETIP